MLMIFKGREGWDNWPVGQKTGEVSDIRIRRKQRGWHESQRYIRRND